MEIPLQSDLFVTNYNDINLNNIILILLHI